MDHGFSKPQRFGVIDGGLDPKIIAELVVKLDGITEKPVLETGVVTVQPAGAFGVFAGPPLAEDTAYAIGRSDA